jgi:hypothetical protein
MDHDPSADTAPRAVRLRRARSGQDLQVGEHLKGCASGRSSMERRVRSMPRKETTSPRPWYEVSSRATCPTMHRRARLWRSWAARRGCLGETAAHEARRNYSDRSITFRFQHRWQRLLRDKSLPRRIVPELESNVEPKLEHNCSTNSPIRRSRRLKETSQ